MPSTKTSPLYNRIRGPISFVVPPATRGAGVTPALDHPRIAGSNISALCVVDAGGITSTLRTLPLGRSVNPASACPMILPGPLGIVQVNVAASKIASAVVNEPESPSSQRPSASTSLGASPIRYQSPAPPFGGETIVHVFATGS